MKLRNMLRRSETIVGLVHDIRKIKFILCSAFIRSRTIRRYLDSNKTRKLMLGAGTTVLTGWLSTDITPGSDCVIYLDATKSLPFAGDSFDYIFSEHMIEHLSWPCGLVMLRECRRILKPGGTIRVATPDLRTLLDLYRENSGGIGEQYIKWITDTFLADVGSYKASFVVNNAFRNWGHQFLYDDELLTTALREAGFTGIRRSTPGESNDEHLRGIDSHGKNVNSEEMARFETMVFEADRPE